MAGFPNVAYAPWGVHMRNYAEEQEAYERAEKERRFRESQRQAMEKTMQAAVLAEFYDYQPIQQSWTSRVLILNSAKPGSKLTGRLDALPVGQVDGQSWGPEYKTLSYVWGEPEMDDNIWIDNKRLAITKSLGTALRRLRPPAGKPGLCIWIDQICINQYDTMERNQQVRLMHAIYRYASEVLVWLGADPDGHAVRAFQLVRSLRSIFGDPLLANLCKAQGPSFSWVPFDYWKSLRELTRLPWFHRVWIPQEIGTDAPATVHWGSESLEWLDLASIMKKLETQGWELKKKHKIDTSAITILFRRFADSPETVTAAAERSSFVYQLCLSARNIATDPRDYVFSRLGHPSAWIESEQAMIIQPDYKNTVAAVYHEIAIRALTTDSTLMVFNAVLDNTDPTKPLASDTSLPSWVPRWNRPRLRDVIGYPGRYEACSARGLNTRSGIITASFLNTYKTLVVRGLVVDTIDRTSPRFAPNCFAPESSKKSQILAAWGLCRPENSSATSNGNGRSRKPEPNFKFSTQGTYPPDPSLSPLQAFLDTLAPTARYSDTLMKTSPTSSSNTTAGQNSDKDKRIYHAGISALANIFPTSTSSPSRTSTASSSQSFFSHKNDPRKLLPPYSSSASSSASSNINLPTGAGQEQQQNYGSMWTTWIQAAEDHALGRRFGITKESGYFALLPPGTKHGDLLCLLRGGETPYVLREREASSTNRNGADEAKRYLFVGEAYVPGLMNESDRANDTGPEGEIRAFMID